MRAKMLLTLTAIAFPGCDVPNFGPVSIANLRVGPGITPEYSWDGGNIDQLLVWRVNDATQLTDSVVWSVRWNNDGFLESPIRHGNPPRNARESVRVEPMLTAGVTYEVWVRAPGLFEGSGLTKRFTPP